MESLKTFIKKNWLIIGLIILCVVLVRSRGTENRAHTREIRALSDSIDQMDSEYLLMEERVYASQELTTQALNDAAMFEDSMNTARGRLITNNIRHAKEVEDFKRIPTDTLYWEYIRRINAISFE